MINEALTAGSAEFTGYFEQPRSALLDLCGPYGFARALEVGCGGGANLAELKRRQPACRTTGIEPHPQAARCAADRADEVAVRSVFDCEFPPATFDLLILSHVLEHFARPDLVLQKVLPWLAADGRVLVALPNVRHVSVLRELVLQGDFRYRSSGLMDHTHLRWFTRRSAERLLREQGLVLERVAPEIQGRKSLALQALSLGMATEFAAFAFNFLARKP